jgi:hypothetical protein
METVQNPMCQNCKYKEMAERNKTPDIGEMLKLAMIVSKMLGQNNAQKQSTDAKTPSQKPADGFMHPVIASMDSLVEDKRIRIIKSSLPFLQPGHQQIMHLVTKLLEIKNIANSSAYMAKTRSIHTVERSPVGMLHSIRPHLEPEEKYTMDIACKALEMINVMSAMSKLKAQPGAPAQLDEGSADREETDIAPSKDTD